jgi:hypothetical protein
MQRFLILAVVGVLSLAGGTGLALGENARPKTPSRPQATKATPPASPGKHPPMTPSTPVKKSGPSAQRPHAQAGKSPSHRGVVVNVPKQGERPGAHNGPKGRGQQPPAKKGPDWGKVGMGVMEGVFGTAAGISAVTGGAEAVATAPTVAGAIPGAVLAGVEGAAAVKEFADAGRDIKEGLDGKK